MYSLEVEREALKLFAVVVDMDESKRASWLEAKCEGDLILRNRLEEMLTADEDDSELYTAGAFTTVNRLDETPEINGYKIVCRIGIGGMGDVYEAERVDGHFYQRVAIKIVRAPLATDQLLEQFAVERQILANLKHPNIVTLLDGGVTKQGLPFVATELVVGLQLDQYLERNDLTLVQKLRLFDQVCAAVEHAHSALVIHRDLKPGNILVETDGTAKLLDFGIAKVISNDINTQTLVGVMTPAYASPEQVLGQVVNTATDVYSLGAILYFLLTGGTVHNTDGLSAAEAERQITTENIDKPSVRNLLASSKRALPIDLDAVTLKALALDPGRRYLSVTAFRADIANFLQRKPVTAQLDSGWYRMVKFVSRHRIGVFATAVTVAALVLALLVSVTQIRSAKDQLARTQAVSDFMGDILMSPASRWDVDISAGPDARMSDVLALAGDHIIKSLGDYPDVQVELLSRVAVALERLSKNEISVGLSEKAWIIASSIDAPESRLKALLSYGKTLTRSSRSEIGLRALLEAKTMLERRGRDRSLGYIYLLNDLGNAYGTFERFEEQRDTINIALELFLDTVGDRQHPALAGAYNHLAGVQMQLGESIAARATTRKALAIVEAPRNKDEVVRAYVHMYAAALEVIDRQYDAAEYHAKIAVAELRRTLGGESKELAVAMARYALISALKYDLDKARKWMVESRQVSKLAQHTQSRDARAAEVIIASYEGDFEGVVREFKPDDFRNTSYLPSQLSLFEVGVAHWQSGELKRGRDLMAEAYHLVGERYASSFRPHLDQRLDVLGVELR